MNKICPCCKVNYRTKYPSKYSTYCLECTNKKNKATYLKTKEKELIRDKIRQGNIRRELHCLKASIGCFHCDEKDPRALDFHHKNPKEKSGQVPDIWRRFGKKAGLEEANKCELLCANCHRKHHYPLYKKKLHP